MIGQKKYVPPNRRRSQKGVSKRHHNRVNEFDMNSASQFPELGAVSKNEPIVRMNYASATKEEEEVSVCVNSVAPGWVKIYRGHDDDVKARGKIRREYGETNNTTPSSHDAAEQTNWGLTATQSGELNMLVNRWQTERDIANDYLDQSSPYWGMKHVHDPLSDDDLESEVGSELSEGGENSDGNDDDDFDDYR